jgi:hypothetical protein
VYGAIDIRNSSKQRNLALQQDFLTHLHLLEEKLLLLQSDFKLPFLEEKLEECRYWIVNVADELTADEELEVRNFFERTITPFLRQVSAENPETEPLIEAYFHVVLNKRSDVYRFSKDFEASQSLINLELTKYFDIEKRKLERKYPVYFESTRTDGLEYNLYAGASISPNLSWHAGIVDDLRLWQLRTMIEVANLTHQLEPKMKVTLQTTQLIIAFGQTINIHFRRDEKKMYVDGANSLGFEIMKKRIDKALVKTTGERLTQPGTIAIVYTSDREIENWQPAIRMLQETRRIGPKTEILALTDVQNISGLKALRLNILFPET